MAQASGRGRGSVGGLGWLKRMSVNQAILKAIVYVLLISIGFVLMVPLAWMISTSLKPRSEIFVVPPKWIPSEIHWETYPDALTSFPFLLYLRNTCVITGFVILGRLLSSSIVAFGFARLRFRARGSLFVLLLSTMMIPYQVTLIPTYILFRELRWLETFKPLIVPAYFGGGAFYIFLLRQFFMTVSLDLDDAARIDGCGTLGIFLRILLPLSRPALATVAIFSFMNTWNDFLGPLIFLSSAEKYTLAIGLANFRNQFQTEWAKLMAASLVVMLPCILLFFFAQRHFIQGVVITGVKG